MDKVDLTCIGCPLGCNISVYVENENIINIEGNSCPKGKKYATNEVTCPVRSITTIIRSTSGKIVHVKLDKTIKKENIFKAINLIKKTTCDLPVQKGFIIKENIIDGANLIVIDNVDD